MRRAATELVALLVFGLTLSAPPAAASGNYDTWAPDARSLGLGGARTSTGGGPAAAHYNPAALSFTDVPELQISFQITEPMVLINAANASGDHPLAPAHPSLNTGYSVGFVFPFVGFLEDWLTFGLVVFFPGTVLSHYRAYDPARPFMYMYDNTTDHYESTVALSLSPFEWFSVGAGVRYAGGQRGEFNVSFDPLRQRWTQQSIDAYQFTQISPTFGVTAGPIGFGWLDVQAGASWWEPLAQPVQVPVKIKFEGLDAEVFAPIDGVSNWRPRTVSIGVAASSDLGAAWEPLAPVGKLTAMADASYQFWSEAPSPFIGLAATSTGEDLDRLGIAEVVQAPGPDQDRVRNPGFSDVARLRTALEWSFLYDLLALRAGYGFRNSPVPDQTSGTNIVDSAVHTVSWGAGLRFSVAPLLDGKIRVDLGWQTQILVPRSVTKVNTADPVGDWTVAGTLHTGALSAAYEF